MQKWRAIVGSALKATAAFLTASEKSKIYRARHSDSFWLYIGWMRLLCGKRNEKRLHAEALLKMAPQTQDDIRRKVGCNDRTVCKWFANWNARKQVRIVGLGDSPPRGMMPYLWRWVGGN